MLASPVVTLSPVGQGSNQDPEATSQPQNGESQLGAKAQ